ncbi:MAG: arylsulfatase, partial [Alphaproteobacteria bacterium]
MSGNGKAHSRRQMLIGSGSLLAAAVDAKPIFAQPAPNRAVRPNILFIMADNLGWGEVGVYGGGATRGAP